jgi:hypothetical protein
LREERSTHILKIPFLLEVVKKTGVMNNRGSSIVSVIPVISIVSIVAIVAVPPCP